MFRFLIECPGKVKFKQRKKLYKKIHLIDIQMKFKTIKLNTWCWEQGVKMAAIKHCWNMIGLNYGGLVNRSLVFMDKLYLSEQISNNNGQLCHPRKIKTFFVTFYISLDSHKYLRKLISFLPLQRENLDGQPL